MSTIEQYNNIRCGVCGIPWGSDHPTDTICYRHCPARHRKEVIALPSDPDQLARMLPNYDRDTLNQAMSVLGKANSDAAPSDREEFAKMLGNCEPADASRLMRLFDQSNGDGR